MKKVVRRALSGNPNSVKICVFALYAFERDPDGVTDEQDGRTQKTNYTDGVSSLIYFVYLNTESNSEFLDLR
jgi:hypothetical protein